MAGHRPPAAHLSGGGWLRRIATGAAAAYFTNDGTTTTITTGSTPPVLSVRTLRVGADLLEHWQTKGRVRLYHDPHHIAGRTAIALGTVEAILTRLAGLDWVQSQWYGGVRLYRLTEAGRAGVAAALNRERPPQLPPAADEPEPGTDREASRP